MKQMYIIILFAFYFNTLQSAKVSHGSTDKALFCAYSSWADVRREDCRFIPSNIDPLLCTHLVYTFARITKNKLLPSRPEDELDAYSKDGKLIKKGIFRKITELKKQNPNMKIILSVGGYAAGTTEFSLMASKPSYREAFIDSTIKLLREIDFDGLDINWQYPNMYRDRKRDLENFPLLLQELREAFDGENLSRKKSKLLLTITVASGPYYIKNSYDIPAIASFPDFINVMTFSYNGALWNPFIGHNSPLYPREDGSKVEQTMNSAWSMEKWSEDVPTEKLLLGVASFGNTYTLTKPEFHNFGDKHYGYRKGGPCTQQNGILGFNEICRMLKNTKWNVETDHEQQVPYAYTDSHWIGYDDVESVKEKAKFVIDHNLGGVFFWSLDTDDFRGFCGEGSFPLLQSIAQSLHVSQDIHSTINEVIETCISSDGKKCQLPTVCTIVDETYFKKQELNCPLRGKCSFPKIQICALQMSKNQLNQEYILSQKALCPTSVKCGSTTFFPSPKESCPVISRCLPDDLGAYNLYAYLCPEEYSFSQGLRICIHGENVGNYTNDIEVMTSNENKSKTPTENNFRGEYPFHCKDEGYFPHPFFCEKFYRCVLAGNNLDEYEYTCPSGLVFDIDKERCEFKETVPECS